MLIASRFFVTFTICSVSCANGPTKKRSFPLSLFTPPILRCRADGCNRALHLIRFFVMYGYDKQTFLDKSHKICLG